MIVKPSNILAFGVLALAILLVFNCTLPHGLWGIVDHQLDMSGDGLKNYYTFAYSIKYHCNWWFEGYLYPYGDYGPYTDNIPLVSSVLGKLYQWGWFDPQSSLLVLIGTGLGSTILSAYLLFLIMRHYKVAFVNSLLMSFFAGMMGPQIFRISAHFALSYSFAIPLFWWLLISLEVRPKIYKYLLLALFTLALAFVHPYMMLSVVMFGLSYVASKYMFIKNFDFKILVSVIIPIVVFLLIGKVLDTESQDRPSNPNGVWNLKTEVADLLPFDGPIASVFKKINGVRTDQTEGYAYPGVLLFIFVLMIPFLVWNRYYNKNKAKIKYQLDNSLKIFFVASLFMLAFAMGLHGLITGYKITDWIPHLAQFRSLGRFSWSFYYVIVVVLSYLFYQMLIQIKSVWWRNTLLAIIMLIYVCDTYAIHKSIKVGQERYQSDDLLHSSFTVLDILKDSGHSADEYQAVITLPVSTEGVEKLSFSDDFFTKIAALPFSYQEEIPLTSCIQSRAPISRVMKILQYANSSFGDHSIQEDIASELPFLIILPIHLRDQFEDIYQKSTLLGQSKEIFVMQITKEKLFEKKYFEEIRDSTYQVIAESLVNVYLEEFEEEPDKGLYSKGAFRTSKKNQQVVQWPIELDTITHFELSFWQYIGADEGTIPLYTIATHNEDQTVKYHTTFRELDFKRVEVAKNWIRYIKTIPMDSNDHFFSLTVSSPDVKLDWIMLKPKGSNVYKKSDNNEIYYSNHLFMYSSEH